MGLKSRSNKIKVTGEGWRLWVGAAHDAPQKWVVLGHSPSERGRARPGLGTTAPVLAEGQSGALL